MLLSKKKKKVKREIYFQPYEDEEGESSEEADDERQRSPYDGLDQATSTSATATEEGEGGTTPDLLRTTKKKTSSGSFDAGKRILQLTKRIQSVQKKKLWLEAIIFFL